LELASFHIVFEAKYGELAMNILEVLGKIAS